MLIVSCESSRKDVNLFSLPSDEKRLKVWLDLIVSVCCQNNTERWYRTPTKLRPRPKILLGAVMSASTLKSSRQRVNCSKEHTNCARLYKEFVDLWQENKKYCSVLFEEVAVGNSCKKLCSE
ncbi:unnamed protein product [Leptidea sinapis]|uniref:Uncharacterized protein n=1 Tax=Leptidea sinapis TaxID=189913 RepID=A0A5E4QK03_9NEOP|nr:unnamed protein product [Leptidea sinapis]